MNVIWICVDSISWKYSLPIMREFAKTGLDCKAIASATSTVMSVSANMTGVPAIFQSRSFDYFECSFPSLAEILASHGYETFSVVQCQEAREKLGPMLGNLSKIDKETWTNDDVNRILEKLVLPDKYFLYVHYNGRYDTLVDKKIRYGMSLLDIKNSIVVLNSDHGFPDPPIPIGHGQVLNEDTMITPLIIRTPGCVPKFVKNSVSSLSIMPTILKELGINYKPPYNDWIRTDTRFISQPDRKSAINGDKKEFDRQEKIVHEYHDNIINERLKKYKDKDIVILKDKNPIKNYKLRRKVERKKRDVIYVDYNIHQVDKPRFPLIPIIKEVKHLMSLKLPPGVFFLHLLERAKNCLR